ncbi:MAG: diacylglycerol/lipid kinase family protein [Micavibrio sp.]
MDYSIYINANSGGIKRFGRDGLAKELTSIFSENLHDLRFLSPEKLRKSLGGVNQSENLLIGGGDGTLATAAAILGKRKIPFGILPLGTMNLFSKDIGLPVDPLDVARLYKSKGSVIRQVDTGFVNDQLFLCNAVIGVTTDLAQKREEDRDVKGFIKWLSLGRETFRKLSGNKFYPLRIICNGEEDKRIIKAAIISNNLYESGPGIASFKKKSLDGGILGIYMVTPEGTLQSLNLLASMALGSWQHDHCIESRESCAVEIDADRTYISVMIDGELRRLRGPLHFKSNPGCLSLLLPGP